MVRLMALPKLSMSLVFVGLSVALPGPYSLVSILVLTNDPKNRIPVMRSVLCLLLALAAVLPPGTSWAGPIEDARAAYDREDYATALPLYRQLAAQGDPAAQFALGMMNLGGEGLAKDPAAALKWFRLSAAQGNALGHIGLGSMYADGRGVPEDHVRASMWFYLGESSGRTMSAESLIGLGTRTPPQKIAAELLADLEKKMTSQQIEDARKLARACQARNFKGCEPAWAEWANIGETGEGTFYLDPATIRKDGNLRRVSVGQDRKRRGTDGEMSVRGFYVFDCKDGRFRVLSASWHSEPMGGGKTLSSESDPGEWNSIAPGTANKAMLNFVCTK